MKNNYFEMKEKEDYIPFKANGIEFNGANYVTISENEGDIILTVECDIKKIEVVFNGMTPFYMSSEEAMRMTTCLSVQQKNNDKYFFVHNLIYIVKNSALLKFVELESGNYYSDFELIHYCIVSDQNIVDVLSTVPPLIYEKE